MNKRIKKKIIKRNKELFQKAIYEWEQTMKRPFGLLMVTRKG